MPSLMNIGFDAKRLFKTKSGLGAYSRSLVRNILLYYPDTRIHLYTPKFEPCDDTAFFTSHPRVHVHVIPSPSWLWRSLILPIIYRRHQLDIYHGLSAELPWISRKGRLKKVITVHDVIFASHPEYYTSFDRWMHHVKLKWSLPKADHIISVSRHTAHELDEHYHPQSQKSIIPPMLDTAHFQPNLHLKDSEFRSLYNLKRGFYLYVGDFSGRKNIDTLLTAMSLIDDESKRRKLVIVSIQDATELLEKAEKLGIDDWIRIENDVNNRILAHYYAYCTAVIYPSNAEGFGIPVLEAISYRARVICSDHPAIKEAGGALPIYFDPNNAHQLSQILISLNQYERKSEEMTLNHLSAYNPKSICDKVMNIYRQV